MGTESVADSALISLEGQVTNEEGIGRRVLLVTECSSAVLGAIPGCSVVTGSGEVDVGLTTIDESTFLGSESSSGGSRARELDVSEALGATRFSVSQDVGTGDLSKLLELAV